MDFKQEVQLPPPEYIKHSHTWTLRTWSLLAADGAHEHTQIHRDQRLHTHTHTQIGIQSILVIGQSAGNCLHFEFV